MSEESVQPVVIVGAGAAGLLAAIFAARRGVAPLVLETRPVPGAKIRVSGGGRCNVLPSRAELESFATSGSRNTLRNILFSWPLPEVRRFFEEELGVPLRAEPNGKLFPASDRSLDILAALLGECGRLRVDIRGGARVSSLERAPPGGPERFVVQVDNAAPVLARRVILATGGLSLPRTGSDGHGLELARQLGHSISDTHPALVPLLAADPGWKALSGIALPTRLQVRKGDSVLEEREGDLLFTHRGFSGPVVLDLSRHLTAPGGGCLTLVAAWLGARAPDWEALLLAPGKRPVLGLLREHLPRRLVEHLAAVAGVPAERTTSDLRREERARWLAALVSCPLQIAGSEGYATAEVTAGGVPLEEVSPRTLESRRVPGLHFAGEILDVVGRIGGYNFLWAWVTGRKAGEGAALGDPDESPAT